MKFLNEFLVYLRRKNSRDGGAMETIYSYSKDLEIDFSQMGNEMSIINEETTEKPANVRFEHIDGHVIIVSIRDIEPGIFLSSKYNPQGEELIGDYRSSEFQDKEVFYFDVFKKIDEFNSKYLTPEEKASCAFEWFIHEGYDVLKVLGVIYFSLKIPRIKERSLFLLV